MFSKKATKIDETFTVNLALCSKRQIDSEDFVNFLSLLRKHEPHFVNVKQKHFILFESEFRVPNTGEKL